MTICLTRLPATHLTSNKYFSIAIPIYGDISSYDRNIILGWKNMNGGRTFLALCIEAVFSYSIKAFLFSSTNLLSSKPI